MKGGSLPLFAWGLLNLALLAINWIWEGTTIHVGEFGYTVLIVWLVGTVFLLLSRQAIRRGPPEPRAALEAVPARSVAAAVAGFAVGLILLGVVFGKFLVFIGGGVLVLSVARLFRELRWQRRSLADLQQEGEE